MSDSNSIGWLFPVEIWNQNIRIVCPQITTKNVDKLHTKLRTKFHQNCVQSSTKLHTKLIHPHMLAWVGVARAGWGEC
jgi:hypothetical protein